jgi:hypothetical protein
MSRNEIRNAGPVSPGELMKEALTELQAEYRRSGQHQAAHRMLTVQSKLEEGDAVRLLELMLSGFRSRRGSGGEALEHTAAAVIEITHQRQPLHIARGNQ